MKRILHPLIFPQPLLNPIGSSACDFSGVVELRAHVKAPRKPERGNGIFPEAPGPGTDWASRDHAIACRRAQAQCTSTQQRCGCEDSASRAVLRSKLRTRRCTLSHQLLPADARCCKPICMASCENWNQRRQPSELGCPRELPPDMTAISETCRRSARTLD